MATGSFPPAEAREMEDDSRRYVFTDWSVQSQVEPLVVAGAQGCRFRDIRGKEYLDFSSQLVNVNIGHAHPKIVRAIQEQARSLSYICPYLQTIPRTRLARMIAGLAPGDLQKTLFTSGGTEANEHALRIARIFSGRQKVITRYRSFHGSTYASLALSGDPRRWASEPSLPGVIHVFDPYCYRCTFGQHPTSCHLECLGHIEEVVWNERPEQVAAIMVEGVTGSNGIIVPPEGYMQGLRNLCDRHGILLIVDEVMSGFGRTGEWFAVDHWKVIPDIMTFAKGVNSGYAPLGGVIVNSKIARYFEDHMFWGGLTNAGHPLACAAAIAALEVYREEGLVENSRELGRKLLDHLRMLEERHLSVGEVRGLGLFAAIELVRDKETREMLVPWAGQDTGLVTTLKRALLERGLYTILRWNIVFVAPPLSITEPELREGLEIIDEVLKIADDAVRGVST